MVRHSLALAIAAAMVAGTAAAETLEFTAGDVGGVWYTTAAGVAQLVQEKQRDLLVKAVPGGGVANPAKLQNGVSQLGLVQSIFATAAVRGTTPFDGKPHGNLRLVAQGLAKNYIHHLRPRGDGKTLADLIKGRGASIALPRSGSTDEYTFRFAMRHYGATYDTIRQAGGKIVQADYGDIANAFKDGQVDAAFVLLGIPGAAVIDAAQGRAAELAPLPAPLIDHLVATYGYTRGAVPAGTYPSLQAGDVATVLTSTSLYSSAAVGEETVYRIVRTICENAARLPDIHKSMAGFACVRGEATGDGSVPLHAGALRYFKEIGIAS
ncbi:MAG: TAXI family TRAP transporter solute-binding subunit [Alphaproteobacteria bacterium]|nr:TAXI family TRAP transporter solute-binding subunit [Alphaproteobacteria bacterium]